jgi:hypothetical protein
MTKRILYTIAEIIIAGMIVGAAVVLLRIF